MRQGWDKMKGMLKGLKMVMREGEDQVRVVKETVETELGEEVIELERLVDTDEVIEITEVVVEEPVEKKPCADKGGKFAFLSKIGEEKRELDGKVKEGRKRGRDVEEVTVRLRSLSGGEKWDRREECVKNDRRWKRIVATKGWVGDEKVEVELCEKFDLPAHYQLGRDQKGVDLNHSDRNVSNFGIGREPLFPTGPGGEEGKNWIASFNKYGCVGCVSESGERMHKGRSGDNITCA